MSIEHVDLFPSELFNVRVIKGCTVCIYQVSSYTYGIYFTDEIRTVRVGSEDFQDEDLYIHFGV